MVLTFRVNPRQPIKNVRFEDLGRRFERWFPFRVASKEVIADEALLKADIEGATLGVAHPHNVAATKANLQARHIAWLLHYQCQI